MPPRRRAAEALRPSWLAAAVLLRTLLGCASLEEDPGPLFGDEPASCLLQFRSRRVAQRKPILWVHLHKAAGSFMCEAALAVGEKIVVPNDNCNWRHHDGYADLGWLNSSTSCSERAEYFRGRYTYGHIERELRASDLCFDDFTYGTVLREPLALMNSEINYDYLFWNGHTKGELLAFLRGNLSTPGDASGPFASHPWKFLDNVQTRLLADAVNVPAGQLGRQHLQLARDRLAKFTVVGRVKDLLDEAGRQSLFDKFGWNTTKLNMNRSNHVKNDIFSFDEAEAAWLRQVNALDYELYESLPTVARSA